MSVSKNLFKSSLIYFVGQVLSKIISFLLLPLYTNYILAEDLGYYDLSISILGVIVPVIFMEIWTGTLRFSIEKKDDIEKRTVINNSMMIGGVSLLLYTILYAIIAVIFPFKLPIWIYIYSFIWIFQLFLLSVARVYGKNGLYAYSGVISVFFNAVITIIAVLLTNGNIISLFLGMIFSMFLQVLIINKEFRIFHNFTRKDFDLDLCKTMVRFSLPLSFNSAMYWMMEGFNKVIITSVLGIGVTGVYAVGNKISVVLNLVISVFNLSWQETIFKITNDEEREQVYNIGFNMLIKVVGSGLVILLPLISLMFPYIIAAKYRSVRNLIPFLLLVIFVNAIAGLLSSCFAAEKDNRGNLIAKIVSCSINVAVLFSTIYVIGFYSSPLAMFIANLIGIAVQIKMIRKHVHIRPQYSHISIFIVMFVISLGIYVTGNTMGNFVWLVVSGMFYCIYLKDFIGKMINLILGTVVKKRKG